MGFSRERPGKDGKPRYVALYRDLKARQRSAGTYATKAAGRPSLAARRGLARAWPRRRPRQVPAETFRQHVEETWLPNHEVEAITRQSYTYALYRHIMPEFGDMRMIDIMPAHVREWVTSQKASGVSPANAIVVLDWLTARGLTLATCGQGDLESWMTSPGATHRREAGHFVRWARAQKLTSLEFPAAKWAGRPGPLIQKPAGTRRGA